MKVGGGGEGSLLSGAQQEQNRGTEEGSGAEAVGGGQGGEGPH